MTSGPLGELGDLNVIYLAFVIEVALNCADHILECGRGGKSGALKHAGGGICHKSAHVVSVSLKTCAHTCNYRFACAEFCFDGGGELCDINYVLVKALALNSYDSVGGGSGNRDDVKADGCGNNATLIVVGVISGKLTSACNGEEAYVAVCTVKRNEFVDGFNISCFCALYVFLAVKHGEFFVERACIDAFDKLCVIHNNNPFNTEFLQYINIIS